MNTCECMITKKVLLTNGEITINTGKRCPNPGKKVVRWYNGIFERYIWVCIEHMEMDQADICKEAILRDNK